LMIGDVFLAGTGAGAALVSAWVFLRGRGGGYGDSYIDVARLGAFIGPIPAAVGIALLAAELGRTFRGLNIYTSNIWFAPLSTSPMNYGSWAMLLFIVFGSLYALSFMPWSRWIGESASIVRISAKYRKPLALICLPITIAVVTYPGIMLAATPSRPFWNSPLLAAVFVLSALLTGIAAIMFAYRLVHKTGRDEQADRRYQQASGRLATLAAGLIIAELIVLVLFILHAKFGGLHQSFAIRAILPGGELASAFWIGAVVTGLLVPAAAVLVFVRPRSNGDYRSLWITYAAAIVIPISILAGGLTLRYVMVIGGQITGLVGL